MLNSVVVTLPFPYLHPPSHDISWFTWTLRSLRLITTQGLCNTIFFLSFLLYHSLFLEYLGLFMLIFTFFSPFFSYPFCLTHSVGKHNQLDSGNWLLLLIATNYQPFLRALPGFDPPPLMTPRSQTRVCNPLKRKMQSAWWQWPQGNLLQSRSARGGARRHSQELEDEEDPLSLPQ